MLAAFNHVERSAAMHEHAEAAASEAIRLDPRLAQAHAVLGSLRLDQFRWQEAEESLTRAIELDPDYAPARHWYALGLTIRGQFDEAQQQLHAARAADPGRRAVDTASAYVHYTAREFDRAIEQYRAVLERDPSDLQAYIGLIETYAASGAISDALNTLDEARRLAQSDDLRLLSAYLYALAGDTDRARELLSSAESQQPVSEAEIASVYGALGDLDAAFAWLQRAVDESDAWVGYLDVDPRYEPLRNDSRFSAVLRKVNLGRDRSATPSSTPLADFLNAVASDSEMLDAFNASVESAGREMERFGVPPNAQMAVLSHDIQRIQQALEAEGTGGISFVVPGGPVKAMTGGPVKAFKVIPD
jgi:tetratricopeptide (TPR) repeat protein